MSIFFILYEATPLPDAKEFESSGGAYINCWVEAESEEEAAEQSSVEIRDCGWQIVSVEEPCTEVTDLTYAEDDEARSYYEQAVNEGACYVYHQWPIEDHEDDEKH